MLNVRLKEFQKELSRIKLYPSVKEETVPWIVSEPFYLNREQFKELELIGEELLEFLTKCWKMSSNEWIQKEFLGSLTEDEKKGAERLMGSSAFPILVRPDIVIDKEGRLWVTEIDLVPAGAGILQRMQEICGQRPTVAEQWSKLITEEIVLSIPEWKDFMVEQQFFVQRVKENDGQMRFITIEDWYKIRDYKGLLFKNCCTISLLNERYPALIPPHVVLCPPVILDWKGWLALAHREDILKNLRLTQRIPETYLLPLNVQRETAKRKELIDLSRKERGEWILKPVAAWGSIGFKDGRNFNVDEWNKAILGLPRTVSRGVLLQKKILSARYEKAGLTISDDLVELKNLSIRVSPYYLFWKRKSTLAGILVTLRQSIKVHGAQDAIFTIAVL